MSDTPSTAQASGIEVEKHARAAPVKAETWCVAYSKDKISYQYLSIPVTSYNAAINASVILQALGYHTYACQYSREVFGDPIPSSNATPKRAEKIPLNSDH